VSNLERPRITGPPAARPPVARPPVAPVVRRRSEIEVRWRQFRNAPRPIIRAVASSLVVAILLGIGYLAYDVALTRGARLPGGDLRLLFAAADVLIVLATGTILTYLIVPMPTGSDARALRTPWSAALGFFAAVPICYLVLVVVVQVLKPLFV